MRNKQTRKIKLQIWERISVGEDIWWQQVENVEDAYSYYREIIAIYRKTNIFTTNQAQKVRWLEDVIQTPEYTYMKCKNVQGKNS